MMPLTFSNTNCHAIAHFLEVGSYREIIVDNSLEVGSYRETRGRQFSIVGRKMVSRKYFKKMCPIYYNHYKLI